MEMSSKTQNNPSIRFKGFTDAWEQRKSHEIFQTITDYVANGSFASLRENVSYSKKKDFAIVVRLTDYSNKYKGPFLYTSELGYKFLKKSSLVKGDILISNVGANAGLVYRAPNMDVPMTLGPNSILVRSDGNDTEFLYQMMKTTYGEKKIKEQIGISAQPKFNKTEFRQIDFFLPSNDEQKQIGTMFSQLDKTIALHQRQLENYSQLKNAMIQKIFNKELRFKNENGNDYSDWEKKRLGEILAEVVRKSTKQDQHVILSSTNKGLFLQSEYFISNIASADNIGYKIMRKSEIVFSPQNLWMGNINYNDKYEIGLVSPSYKIFAISEEVIPKFMKYMIKTPYLMNEYLLSSEQGASVVRRNLDMDLFNKILVEIPSLPEQHQIASFLVALDCNIDQLTRKIELVKDKKKGLLQLMFI